MPFSKVDDSGQLDLAAGDRELLAEERGPLIGLDAKAAATDGSYKAAWDKTLGKSGTAAPELDTSKMTNCA